MAPHASAARSLLTGTRGFIPFRFVLFLEDGSRWSKRGFERLDRTLYAFGGRNNGMMVRLTRPRRDSLPPLSFFGASTPDRGCWDMLETRSAARLIRSLRETGVIEGRRRASMTCRTGCCRETAATRCVQHRHVAMEGENSSPIDGSNEFSMSRLFMG